MDLRAVACLFASVAALSSCAGDAPADGGGGEGEGEGEAGEGEGEGLAINLDGGATTDDATFEVGAVIVTLPAGTTIDASDEGGAPLTGEAVLSVRALSVDGAPDAIGIEVALTVDGTARLAQFDPPLDVAIELGVESPADSSFDIGALADGAFVRLTVDGDSIDAADAAERFALDAVAFDLAGGFEHTRIANAGVYTIERFVPLVQGTAVSATQTQTVLLLGDAATRTRVRGWELVLPTTGQVVSSISSIAASQPVGTPFIHTSRLVTTAVTLIDTAEGRAVQVETDRHNEWVMFLVVSNDAGAGTVTTQVDLPGECVAEVCTDGLAAYAGIVDVKMTIDSLTDALDMAQALRDVDPGANVSIKYVNAFTREGVAMYRRDLPSLLLLPALDGIDKGTIKTRVLPLSFSPAEPVIDVVTRDTSRGQVSVSLSTFSDCPEAFLRSADGATEFSDTLSCTGEGGESGTATMSFTESYVGNELIVVTASGSGNATDGATAGSEYSLELTVAQTTQVLIDAEVTGGENSGLLFQFFGPNGAAGGVLLDDRDGGAVNETVTLVPGRYVCIVAAVSGGIPASGAVSFSLGLTFGP